MGWFSRKKEYKVKNMERDDAFLKDTAMLVNGLMRYTEDNERVTKALKKLKDDFEFTVGSGLKSAEKNEKEINKLMASLKELLKQSAWDEDEAIRIIRDIGMEIDEINAKK